MINCFCLSISLHVLLTANTGDTRFSYEKKCEHSMRKIIEFNKKLRKRGGCNATASASRWSTIPPTAPFWVKETSKQLLDSPAGSHCLVKNNGAFLFPRILTFRQKRNDPHPMWMRVALSQTVHFCITRSGKLNFPLISYPREAQENKSPPILPQLHIAKRLYALYWL
jgi:hypothetical protein